MIKGLDKQGQDAHIAGRRRKLAKFINKYKSAAIRFDIDGLARKFGVSRRTIQSDIRWLRDNGIITGDLGKGRK